MRFSLSRPDWFLAVVGSVFGLAFLIRTPPMQVPDESAHFFRAYQISEGHFLPEKREGNTGGRMPLGIRRFTWSLRGDIPFHYDHKLPPSSLEQAREIPLDPSEGAFEGFNNQALYSPLVYLPQAAGVALVRWVGGTPYWMFYFARLFNLALSLGLFWYAVNQVPRFRWLFAGLALSPMMVFLRSSVSCDAVIDGIGFVFAALCLKMMLEPGPAGRRQLVLLGLCAILLGVSKQAYLGVSLFAWLIPAEKFGDRRRKFLYLSAVTVLALLAVAHWYVLVRPLYSPTVPDNNLDAQVSQLLTRPLGVAGMLLRFFQRNGAVVLEQFVGYLGYLDTRLPPGVVWPLFLFYILLARVDGAGLSAGQKWGAFGIACLNTIGVTLLIYLTGLRVGATEFVGVQGRYLLPFAPLFFLIFAPEAGSRGSRAVPAFQVFVVVALAVCLNVLSKRYYVAAGSRTENRLTLTR